ncbi:hypothetical protein VNO77_02112 [Canavalia gladiata]|uniref:Uncharacterized protein n=1 Tax=Canavalia gladiata TaxID=3824 RepID=A0AAN9MSL8_CANGL
MDPFVRRLVLAGIEIGHDVVGKSQGFMCRWIPRACMRADVLNVQHILGRLHYTGFDAASCMKQWQAMRLVLIGSGSCKWPGYSPHQVGKVEASLLGQMKSSIAQRQPHDTLLHINKLWFSHSVSYNYAENTGGYHIGCVHQICSMFEVSSDGLYSLHAGPSKQLGLQIRLAYYSSRATPGAIPKWTMNHSSSLAHDWSLHAVLNGLIQI